MKIIIVALAVVAVALAEEEVKDSRGKLEFHRANRAEWVEKFKAMSEEEKQEKMREIREHIKTLSPEALLRMRNKFESMRAEKFEKIHPKLPGGAQAYGMPEPVIVPAASHTLTDDERKVLRENFRKMSPEEREEIRRQIGDRPRRPRPNVNGNFQKPRDRLEDIMVGEEFIVNVQ